MSTTLCRRVRVEIDDSLATLCGAHKILIALPKDNLPVADFLSVFQQRHLGTTCLHLLCHVDGFTLPPSQLVPQVLKDEDVLVVCQEQGSDSVGLARPLKRRRVEVTESHTAVGQFPHSPEVPRFNPRQDRGTLFEALSICGAVFVPCGTGGLELTSPRYAAWHDLWKEAASDFKAFKARPPARSHHLRFSQGEDLLRTLSGESKAHTPDVRYNFGVGQTALKQGSKAWKELKWIPEDFQSVLLTLSQLVAAELHELTDLEKEPKGTLGANVLSELESWAGSRLRHSLYPGKGSCTEHTDYGVLTLQQSTGSGLEALIGGAWRPLEPPEGFVVLFAGDMLEILTNGRVRALHHRVCMHSGSEECARQSNIIFLQPDNDTWVQPLMPYRTGQYDLPAVRYGDWHKKKTSLAFQKPA